jgi:hypothetical protein
MEEKMSDEDLFFEWPVTEALASPLPLADAEPPKKKPRKPRALPTYCFWSLEADIRLMYLHAAHRNHWARITEKINRELGTDYTYANTQARWISLTRYRVRTYSLQEDQLLLDLRNNERLTWQEVQAAFFGKRTVRGLQKRYSELMSKNQEVIVKPGSPAQLFRCVPIVLTEELSHFF